MSHETYRHPEILKYKLLNIATVDTPMFRYISDIFEKRNEKSFEELNNFDCNLKLTQEFIKESFSFLDIALTLIEGKTKIELFLKIQINTFTLYLI